MAEDIDDIMKRDYTVLVRQQDGGFFSEIAELPGCWAEGDTAQEARDTLKEAMRLWVKTQLDDGQPIPPPRNPVHVNMVASPWLTFDTTVIVNETSQRIFSDLMWTYDFSSKASDFIAMPR